MLSSAACDASIKVPESNTLTEEIARGLVRAGLAVAHQLLGQAYRTLRQTADAVRELKQADQLTRNPTKP